MKRLSILVWTMLIPTLLLLTAIDSNTAEANEGYVGQETCIECHEKTYQGYVNSVHNKKAISGTPTNREGCESCHGPGAEHVEKGGGKGTGMFVFDKKEDAEKRSAICNSCHEDSKTLAFWNMNRHKRAGNACDDCHSVHKGVDKAMLIAREPDLCFKCHQDIRSQTNRQSRHPVNEKFATHQKLTCSSCHDTMGAFVAEPVDSFVTRTGTGTGKMLRADSLNELCYRCHADKRGPFLWEHPPVEENCLICHEAHGSNHNKLLTRKVPMVCQSCHTEGRHPSQPYTNLHSFSGAATSSKNRFVARSCLNCHTNVHGSNGPGAKGKTFVR